MKSLDTLTSEALKSMGSSHKLANESLAGFQLTKLSVRELSDVLRDSGYNFDIVRIVSAKMSRDSRHPTAVYTVHTPDGGIDGKLYVSIDPNYGHLVAEF